MNKNEYYSKETLKIAIIAFLVATNIALVNYLLPSSIGIDFSLKVFAKVFILLPLVFFILYPSLLGLNLSDHFKISEKIVNLIYTIGFFLTITIIYMTAAVSGLVWISINWISNMIVLKLLIFLIFGGPLFITYKKIKKWIGDSEHYFKLDIGKLWPNFKRIYDKIVSWASILFGIFFGVYMFLGLTNYTALELQKDKIDFIFNLIFINISLFGFTLVGSVFETRGQKVSKTEIELFRASLSFLGSTLMLLMFLALTHLPKTTPAYQDLFNLAVVPLFFAIIGFVIGIIGIFRELSKYLDKLDPS